MAGYGGEKFHAVAELTQSEVVNLWANLRNKDQYLISRDGMVLRYGSDLYAKGTKTLIRKIATFDEGFTAIFIIDAERNWAGPARALAKKEAERLCGKNGQTVERDGEVYVMYTMPRMQSPDLSPEEIHRVTSFSFSGGTLRVTHANGYTTSYHYVEKIDEHVVQTIDHEAWKDNPEGATKTQLVLDLTVRMAEARYDPQNNTLPQAYPIYYWPDGSWQDTRYDGDVPPETIEEAYPEDYPDYDEEDDDDGCDDDRS